MTKSDRENWKKPRPNILFIMVDEMRVPMVYENEELREWRKQHLPTQELLAENGLSFENHYIGSSACTPSRATLFTGQYPSLHGVTQTPGAAKGSFDADLFWLDPNTVPTLGDYFRKAGYQTFYKGKWHISDEDILIPGTKDALATYNPKTGIRDRKKERIYEKADRLDPFGFSGWIGPEPHGSDPRNSASSAAHGVKGRDVVYADQVVSLIKDLDKQHSQSSDPWLIVSSFVNPHDIALYGLYASLLPIYDFAIDPSVPFIPPAPTAKESLDTKPSAQRSYQEVYQKALQPTLDTPEMRRFYYSLFKEVDQEMFKVFQALKESTFYEDTIVVFTADHGDLLGAHGGLFQKWHNAYEESVHVPFIIHNPKLFPKKETTSMLTSHVDLIPTLLGLANIKVEDVQEKLKADHSEVHPLVGRDLSPHVLGRKNKHRMEEAVYFMTDDEPTKGLNQVTLRGEPYESVIQPNHVETVIVKLKTGENRKEEIWKFSRYFDDPQFWTDPNESDESSKREGSVPISDEKELQINRLTTKTVPAADEFELYNLSNDPLEEKNLAHPTNATAETKVIQKLLYKILKEQREKKRNYPSGN